MLSKNELANRIHCDSPIVRGYKDLDKQLQQCGVDIRLGRVWREAKLGDGVGEFHTIDFDNSKRAILELPEIKPMTEGEQSWFYLRPGHYLFQSIEKVWIPNDLCAISSVRSTLMRTTAVTTDSPLFDPGYLGPDNTSIIVPEPGWRIELGARYTQMVFFELSSPIDDIDLYQGVYNEKVG
jgi:deoxycytidine triphosphate deaminase